MSVTLPTSPAPAEASPTLRRFGGDLVPGLGGAIQRITRLGTRFAVEFAFPPMVKASAEPIIAALLDADAAGDTILAAFPQRTSAGALGAPVVNGAGQTGSTLNANGFTSGVTIPRGSPFSFVAAGRNYLHLTRTAIVATGGAAALPIAPLLRASPANAAALQFATPQIEGFVEGREIPWRVDAAGLYQISFTLFEPE